MDTIMFIAMKIKKAKEPINKKPGGRT